VGVKLDGLTETLRAFQQLDKELRREANGELRKAARECAAELAVELRAAAAASPTPVAGRVATSIRVRSDRIPVVIVGGNRKVGVRGGRAGALVWGSELGGEHFAAGRGPGYWIAPTVRRFATNGAVTRYKRAVYDLLRKYGLA
jgi:hypothetical protein